MPSLLQRTTFFVKEHVGLMKIRDTYDLMDPADGQKIGFAKEETPGWIVALRLLLNKQLLPATVRVYEQEGSAPVAEIRRGMTLFLRSTVKVFAANGVQVGTFKSKIFSIGGGFHVYDTTGKKVANVKGDWKGWNFKFLDEQGQELGTVTKKWAGLGKELFTSADNYIVSLNESLGKNPAAVVLLLCAGLAIDIVFKESK